MAKDKAEPAEAGKAFVAKELASWKETATNGTVLDEILAVPLKALALYSKGPNQVIQSDVANVLQLAVKRGATLTRTKEDVVRLVSLPHSDGMKPFYDNYNYNFNFGNGRHGDRNIALALDKAAPTSAEAMALAETLAPIDRGASSQVAEHATKVATTFEEAFSVLKGRFPKPADLLRWNWNDESGWAARRALHATTTKAKDPVDVMKALAHVGSTDADRATWLASSIGHENNYSQAWTLARTARILGDTKAESAALSQATRGASSVVEALSIAAVAREGRLADPVINDAIVKASTLANRNQNEGVLELADKIRKGIILEEARKPKIKVTVNNSITVSGGGNDLPEAQTLGQAVMDYFGMRRNAGGYR